MSEISYDGFGINGSDKYRTRIATFNQHIKSAERSHYGKLFEAAPEMLAALKELLGDLGARPGVMHLPSIHAARDAVAKAEGREDGLRSDEQRDREAALGAMVRDGHP